MKTIAELEERLKELHQRTAQTPLFNPVFQLSLDLSRLLESGDLTLDDCAVMIAELECDALKSRARHLRDLLPPVGDPVIGITTAPTADTSGTFDTFDAFREHWEHPVLHAVFTAHPTFLLSPAQSAAIATAAASKGKISSTVCTVSPVRPQITLSFEHGRAMRAISHAQNARDRINAHLLSHAQKTWPDRWHELKPLPFRFATWIGYDMDGRTDITWADSIRFRLAEKADRLARYCAALEEVDANHPLLDGLNQATDYAEDRVRDFAVDLEEVSSISAAANNLTAAHPAKLLSLADYIEKLEAEARSAPAERGIQLKTLAAAMRADGLGMGRIHFRVNAKQLHNALRRTLDPKGALDLGGKGAIVHLRKAIAQVRPLSGNFAALAIESSTAIRQFLAMAQILHHIDSDSPIRMLIAECEDPATVLGALYFAKLFGIADKIDVSPLLETERALEHGGRFLDALLAEEEFREYARKRGRVAIETGFSDAGRFVGQIPASLAIERLQGRLAQAMQANGLTDVAALVFNTHGESMGRGAHPSSLTDRLTWPLSRWARNRFARAGIRLIPEVSFQGGDGYLFFEAPDLALATLSGFANADFAVRNELAEAKTRETSEIKAAAFNDPFYQRIDLSLDFYRAIREQQHALLESRTYARAVTAFGLGLINSTGSRVSRRQSDISADHEMNLRQIRAIPHNAILQQLGYPVNVIGGAGTAAAPLYEDLAQLLQDSQRGRQIVRFIRAANTIASIKTVAAFGELFNSAYWASRPYRGMEDHLAEPCAALAEHLVNDDRSEVFRRFATQLRVDALKLHRLLALIPDEDPDPEREHARRAIGVCQSLRLALLQHMFLRAVSIPAFTRANDISREDVLEMVFTLRIDEALLQLRHAYPTNFPRLDDFDMDEPTQYPEGGDAGYDEIRRNFIDPIERANVLSLRISTAIANRFGAHG